MDSNCFLLFSSKIASFLYLDSLTPYHKYLSLVMNNYDFLVWGLPSFTNIILESYSNVTNAKDYLEFKHCAFCRAIIPASSGLFSTFLSEKHFKVFSFQLVYGYTASRGGTDTSCISKSGKISVKGHSLEQQSSQVVVLVMKGTSSPAEVSPNTLRVEETFSFPSILHKSDSRWTK